MEQEIKPCCKNCKNFIRHYVKNKLSFWAIGLGRCTKNLRKQKFYSVNGFCELWEQQEDKSEEVNKRAKDAILLMHE